MKLLQRFLSDPGHSLNLWTVRRDPLVVSIAYSSAPKTSRNSRLWGRLADCQQSMQDANGRVVFFRFAQLLCSATGLSCWLNRSQDMFPWKRGDFIVYVPADVFHQFPCYFQGSNSDSCFSKSSCVASTRVFNAWMSISVSWILMPIYSRGFWVRLLTDAFINCATSRVHVIWESRSFHSPVEVFLDVGSNGVYRRLHLFLVNHQCT
jgi:hypothetical protein